MLNLPNHPPSSAPIVLADLLGIGTWQDELAWQPMREGVEIFRLYGDGISGPNAALLRFQPGSHVPEHFHPGYEHILVLHGSQNDGDAEAPQGTLTINQPGARHRITSAQGCIVLAIYEKPVQFRES